MACKKLRFKTIPVRYKKGVSEKDLLILNLTENIQRKEITSIEIGKFIYELIKNKEWNITKKEIAVSLGISFNRVDTCLRAYTSLPAEFRKDVVYLTNSQKNKGGVLAENVVDCILNLNKSILRENRQAKLTGVELNHLFKFARDEGLPISKLYLLKDLLVKNVPYKKAIKMLDDYTVLRVNLIVLKTELDNAMKKAGTRQKGILISEIIKSKYPNLVY